MRRGETLNGADLKQPFWNGASDVEEAMADNVRAISRNNGRVGRRE
jgi:hypothetical protein